MRRLVLVLATSAALAATSLAGGALRNDRTMSTVTATFTATTVGSRATTACSSSDGTFQITKATYTGTSNGDPALAGPVRLTVRAAINTTRRLGTIDGTLVVDRRGRDTRAHLTGVYRDGTVSGLLAGQAMPAGQRFLGTFTASYSPDGGFGAGGIGVGNLDPAALRYTEGDCAPTTPARGQLKLLAGNVLALSDFSITVGLTTGGTFSCMLDAGSSAEVAQRHISVGDQVSGSCRFTSGVWTLLHVTKLPKQTPQKSKKR